jgi:hypothetical protein
VDGIEHTQPLPGKRGWPAEFAALFNNFAGLCKGND